MKNLNNYILEKLVIDKNVESSFKTILSKLEDWEFLCLPGEVYINVAYDKKFNIYSLKVEDGTLYADLVENDPDRKEDNIKTVEIDEKTFNKLFSKKDIEEIIKTLDES